MSGNGMWRTMVAGILAALGVGISGRARAQQGSRPAVLSPQELTAIHSLVGGNVPPGSSGAGPRWAPDGSRIMFPGSLGGSSDLWTIAPDGGSPASLNIHMQAEFFFPPPPPAYSPDGRWIAYVSNRTGAAELYVHAVDDGREVQLTRMGARINSYSWAPDGHAIAVADDRYGNYDIYVVAVPDGTVRRLTSDVLNEVFPSWTPDGKRVLFVQLDDPWLKHTVFSIDGMGRDEPRSIAVDTAFFDYGEGTTFGYPLVSPDGSTVLFRSQRSGWINYWIVPIGGGAVRAVAPEPANQSGAHWSPDGKSILYLALWNGMQDVRVVSATGGAPRVLVRPEDMGVAGSAEWSPNGARVSYTLQTPVTPADLYVIPTAGGTPTRLTNSAGPAYLDASLIRPKKITYPSADGLTIHAYLYEPVLKLGEKAPGILFIHGGPTNQFSDTYELQAQYFAMHGYAVLAPNIRGSSGYGTAFEDANNGCWGRCDLKDVAAGVALLRKLPYINPARMGITGTSYGGCMSIAATAFAPGLFQASIPQSGYGDWVHFYEEEELRHIKLVLYELGPMPQSMALYRSLSAINYIDSIQTPMFLLHGEGTPGLPKGDDARLFADRLEMRYKPYKYKTYPDELYYVRKPANIHVMLGDMLAFFDQYLKDNEAGPESHLASATADQGARR